MKTDADAVHKLETEWIRSWARIYLPYETATVFSAEAFRKGDLSLVDLMHVLGAGIVVHAEKLDEPGARWVVVGEDAEERRIQVTIVVISECYEVDLIDIQLLKGDSDGSDDAA